MTSSDVEPDERAGEVPDDDEEGDEGAGEAGDTAGVVSEADR